MARTADGAWSSLAGDAEVQRRLVAAQIAFGRVALAADGERDTTIEGVEILDVQSEGGIVTLRYRATIRATRDAGLPTPENGSLRADLSLPLDPTDVLARAADRCASAPEGKLTEATYPEYFDPARPGCDLPLATPPR